MQKIVELLGIVALFSCRGLGADEFKSSHRIALLEWEVDVDERVVVARFSAGLVAVMQTHRDLRPQVW